MLIDDFSEGSPERAGRAYTINITGSILGPLVAAYVLLPSLGARGAMVALALPFAGLFVSHGIRVESTRRVLATSLAGALTLGALVQTTFFGRSFEEGSHIAGAVVRRDHTATVISYGRGFGRRLLVNGYGMTVLTPLTKIMAHLPLVALDHTPHSAAVIAFGMGTTFRSLLTWDIDVTAVELVPSVVEAFGYYHADAEAVESDPHAHIVIDDGRRFLARSREQFDLITIDPPPPVETAGSSLLYAAEFYDVAKARLAPGGIVQHWFPDAANVEPAIRRAVLRSAVDAFPYVRVFLSLQGRGLHILCSMQPIEVPDAAEFVARMPERAREDLMEWSKPGADIEAFVQHQILDRETSVEAVAGDLGEQGISDDRPINEYFIMRRYVFGDDAGAGGAHERTGG
jgi:spermidine synthase